jgi:hypothetical protein
MPEISNSEVQAAVSAIMQRDRSKPPPRKTPQPLAALSELRRAHLELLQSELAKAGLDFGRLEKLYDEDKEKAGKLVKKLTPSDDSEPGEPTETDRESTKNRKRVYELIAGRPLVTFPIVLDAPTAIYSVPSAPWKTRISGAGTVGQGGNTTIAAAAAPGTSPTGNTRTSRSCSPGKTTRRTWPSSSAAGPISPFGGSFRP